MFKPNAIQPIGSPSQNSLIFSVILGAIKEALLLNKLLDQLKESIMYFITQAKADDSFELAVQTWNSIVAVNIRSLTSTTWEYLSDEITIVEHPGLSTYKLNWSKEFIKQSKLISVQLQIVRDFLDANQVVTLAEELQDLVITTSYNVEVYLWEYVRSSLGEVEYGESKSNYLAWRDK